MDRTLDITPTTPVKTSDAVTKTVEASPPTKARRYYFWYGLVLLGTVCASVSVGVVIGWFAKPDSSESTTMTVSTGASSTATSTSTNRPSFLHMGDSLTEQGGWSGGWVALLQEHYKPAVDVLNRGRSGFNTHQTLDTVLPSVLDALHKAPSPPAFITVWLGANDAALANGPNAGQHIPIDEYKANLRIILQALRKLSPLSRIVLITPPTVDDDTRRQILVNDGKAADPLDRSNEQAAAYAAACGEVATALDGTADRVTLLDMHRYLMETYPTASERAALLRDGLHFSDSGNRVVFEQVKKQVDAFVLASLRAV